jgi:hypothetical protein
MAGIKTSIRDPECVQKVTEYARKHYPDIFRYWPETKVIPIYIKDYIRNPPSIKRDELLAVCDDGPFWRRNPDGTWNSEAWIDYNEEYIHWVFVDWRGYESDPILV